MPTKLVNGPVDGATIVAAPAANQFVRVHGLDLTASAASEITLKSNDTVIWRTDAADDAAVKGGIVLPFSRGRALDCLPGQALKIGVEASGSVHGTIDYMIYGPPSASDFA